MITMQKTKSEYEWRKGRFGTYYKEVDFIDFDNPDDDTPPDMCEVLDLSCLLDFENIKQSPSRRSFTGFKDLI